jgi:acetyl esterase/lipase
MSQTDRPDPHAPPTFGERVTRIIGAVAGDPIARAELDMARVLDELKALGAEPIEDLTPEEARRQPTPADAVSSLMAKFGIPPADAEIRSRDVLYPGAECDLPARIYQPPGGDGPRPLILYFRGGGWVFADLDDYDSSPRAIAARTGAVVVSADFRRAPEHKFPAAHEDAVAAYRWVVERATELGGDGERFAIVGESAGGNLAINVAIAARDQGLTAPKHLALIYPLAGVDMSTPSFRINEHARPLNKAIVGWLLGHALLGVDQKEDPRLDLVNRADLHGLPPTTLLTAEIDPLRSEGHMLADKLRGAGVAVNAVDFEGVAHGFFGMGDLVRHARSAQELIGRDLGQSLAPLERGARVGRAL